MRTGLLLLITLSCTTLVVAQEDELPEPTSVLQADLLGDGHSMDLAVFINADRELGFFVQGWPDTEGLVSPIFPIWDAEVADIDGDGRDELVVGADDGDENWGRSIWVLAADERGQIEAIWRGSRMSNRRLLGFAIGASEDGTTQQVLALETARGQCVQTVYEWNGFGFDAQSTERVTCPVGADIDYGEVTEGA